MTYDENLRDDINEAIKILKDNQDIANVSIEFITTAILEKLNNESINAKTLKNADKIMEIMKMEESVGLFPLRHKAMLINSEMDNALQFLVKMNKVNVNKGIVSIVK